MNRPKRFYIHPGPDHLVKCPTSTETNNNIYSVQGLRVFIMSTVCLTAVQPYSAVFSRIQPYSAVFSRQLTLSHYPSPELTDAAHTPARAAAVRIRSRAYSSSQKAPRHLCPTLRTHRRRSTRNKPGTLSAIKSISVEQQLLILQ